MRRLTPSSTSWHTTAAPRDCQGSQSTGERGQGGGQRERERQLDARMQKVGLGWITPEQGLEALDRPWRAGTARWA